MPRPLARFVTAVNQPSVSRRLLRDVAPSVEGPEGVRCDGLARFDLQRIEPAAFFDDEIDLETVAVSPKIEIRVLSSICPCFKKLRRDSVLEDRPPQGMKGKLLFGLNAKETAEQPRVVEIEFCRSDKTLVEILEYGRTKKRMKPIWRMESHAFAVLWVMPHSAPSEERLTSCPARPAQMRRKS